jgi:uncharacterized protein (TIGR00725 family)
MKRKPVIGVMGGGVANAATSALAEELGEAIAREGWILLNGGRDAGVMAASAHGAARAGGLVLGILPGRDLAGAAPDLTIGIPTGLGDARNVINVLASDVVVAMPGGAGTLSEIALALKNERPLLLLGWPREPELPGAAAGTARRAASCTTAAEAIAWIRERLPA